MILEENLTHFSRNLDGDMTHNELYNILKQDTWLLKQKDVNGYGIDKSSIGEFYIKVFTAKELGSVMKHKIANRYLKNAPVVFEVIGEVKAQ